MLRISKHRSILSTIGIVGVMCSMLGCASNYATPGRGADMRLFGSAKDQASDAVIVKTLAKTPLATLPTAIAVIRVQAPGYASETTQSWGKGAFSIVLERDISNEDAVWENLRKKMPMIKGWAPISRLLLPEELQSDLDLRQAAASLHADMLLIYTLDTSFNIEDVAAPVSVITLGLSPNQVAHVICTASAVLLDTRNGYVYGIADATERQSQLASAWTSAAAVDQTRKRVEAKAFEKMAGQLQLTWKGVVMNLTTTPTETSAR